VKKIGTLCDAHSALWQRWAGWPEGWGPGNPMPAGVTAEGVARELAAIREACKSGYGCGGADEPAGELAAINRGRGVVDYPDLTGKRAIQFVFVLKSTGARKRATFDLFDHTWEGRPYPELEQAAIAGMIAAGHADDIRTWTFHLID
jgi:hypothetical protein